LNQTLAARDTTTKENAYLALARQGRNGFWRYLVTLAAVIAVSIGTTLVLMVVAYVFEQTLDPNAYSLFTLLTVTMLPFPAMLVTLWLSQRFLHRRPIRTLVTPARKINWKAALISGVVWFALAALGDLVLSFLQPGNYTFSYDSGRFWKFALLSLVLVPLQTSTEEFLFRGYLTQGLGLLGRTIWLPWILPSLVFGLLHSANPEVGLYGFLWTMPSYIGVGLLLGWITLKSEGLEPALGLHAANNLYASWIVTFAGSSLPVPTLFTIREFNPQVALAVFAVSVAAYLAVFYLFPSFWRKPAPDLIVEGGNHET